MISADWRSLNSALAALFAPGLTTASFSARAAAFVRQIVPCDLVSVGSMQTATGALAVEFDAYNGDLPVALQGYAAHMHNYRPFNYDPAAAGGGPIMLTDFMSARQFRQTDIFQDGFGRVGITDHAAIPIRTDDGALWFIGLERCGGGGFRGRDRKLLGLIQPHIDNARRIAVAHSALPAPPDAKSLQAHLPALKPREADVLAWLIQGKSNAEIAAILRLRLQTVKGYLGQIYDKLGVGNRHAAALRGLDLARQHVTSEQQLPIRVNARARSR